MIVFLLDHEVNHTWHGDWEDGICMYEDEDGKLIVERKIHRHPLGTEYVEILED